MHSPSRSAHLEHTLTEFDARIDRARLFVTAAGRMRCTVGVPLDVERDRHDLAEGPREHVVRLVDEDAVRFVAEAPLAERCIARMPRPHLGGLQFEPRSQTDSVEFLDVQVRMAATHETGHVVEPHPTQFETDEQADVGGVVPTPPAPRLDGGTSVAKFVRIGQHARQTMGVIRYLSHEWLDALSADVAASADLQRLAATHRIGITQAITDGPDGTVIYHLQVGDGVASFGWGSAFPEDVRMEQSWDTAVGVATGTLNAQEAFIKGRIKLSGNQQLLTESHEVFGALDAIFSSLRERTDYR